MTVRLPEDLYKQAQELADHYAVSVGTLVRMFVADGLRRRSPENIEELVHSFERGGGKPRRR